MASTPAVVQTPVAEPTIWRQFPSRVATFCLVELQKLSHDRTEAFTRAVQPVLWMVIFGETFNRLHAIPTNGVPYLDFLAPGIIARIPAAKPLPMISAERGVGVTSSFVSTPASRSQMIWIP